MSETILEEATRIINGARKADYGDAQESFDRIAGLWTTYLDGFTIDAQHPIRAHDVVNLMCLLKIARARNGYHRDSYVDIAGYAGLTELLE